MTWVKVLGALLEQVRLPVIKSKLVYDGFPKYRPDGRIIATTAAAAPPFSPTDIAALKAWYDADQIVGLNDGDAVVTWTDATGNGHDITQGTAGNRPLYKTNIINGQPIVRFDGTDDYLSKGSAVTLTQTYTLVAVVKHNTGVLSSGAHRILNATNAVGILYVSNAEDRWTINAGASLTSNVIDTSWHSLICLFNGASSSITLDGVETTGNAGTGNQTTTFLIGADNGGGNAAPMDLAEAMLIDDTLTAGEITNLLAYFATKYGI